MNARIRSPLLERISSLGTGFDHGFGTIDEPIPAHLLEKWSREKPSWRQVHGATASRVDSAGQTCGDCDALWSSEPGRIIGVVTADCVPILIASRDGTLVAAIHAGWKGSFSHIATRTIEALAESNPRSRGGLVAAIGPSIRQCCFEVSEELQEQFVREFPQLDRSRLNPRHRHLDLAWLNRELLLEAGVEEVEILGHCTKCAGVAEGHPRFHSYRREGGGTRQYSLVTSASGMKPRPA